MRSRKVLAVLAVCLALAAGGPAKAGSKVSYSVELKPLRRSTMTSTALTVRVFSDPNCEVAVGAPFLVEAGAVSILEEPRPARLKGARPTTPTARVEIAVPGPSMPIRYARIDGAGIVAMGGLCQLQALPEPTGAVLVDSRGTIVGVADGVVNNFGDLTTPRVIVANPHGEPVPARITRDGFLTFGAGPLLFESADCSGPPLLADTGATPIIGLPVGSVSAAIGGARSGQHVIAGAGTTIYAPAGELGPVTIRSKAAPSGHADCVGGVFTPPGTCCEAVLDGPTAALPTIGVDVSQFVPPFRFLVR